MEWRTTQYLWKVELLEQRAPSSLLEMADIPDLWSPTRSLS